MDIRNEGWSRAAPTEGLGRVVAVALTAVVAVVAVACHPSPVAPLGDDGLQAHDRAGVVLLTQNVIQDATMDALYEGPVVADDAGCLRLGGSDGPTAVWPQGYTAQSALGDAWIRDASGTTVGQVGGSFSLGGGEVPELSDAMGFTQADRDLAEDHCPGLYWIVG